MSDPIRFAKDANPWPEPGTELGRTVTAFDRFHYIVALNEGGHVSEEQAAAIGDPGGETMWGITEVTLRGLGIDKRPAELTPAEARAIYFEHYWKPVRELCRVEPALALMAYDFGVQSGPRQAARTLQRVVGATADGIIGPRTLTFTRVNGIVPTILDYATARRDLLRGWVSRDSRREVLRKGLAHRVDRVMRSAFAELATGDAQFRHMAELWRGGLGD